MLLLKHSKGRERINTNSYRLRTKKWHQVIPLSRIPGLLEWQTLELCSPNRRSQVLHGLAARRIFLSLSTPSGLKELSRLSEPQYGMHSFIGELYFLHKLSTTTDFEYISKKKEHILQSPGIHAKSRHAHTDRQESPA